ncbi:amidohydrolase [Psychromonas aquimarina]|uniref:amidohydrolase n=1 Tax=Psychromonas aquimarina TaxID=444919 RepID=UPI0004082FC8|nr:amidohydrolase [Psychromonas aquimarina]
MKNKINSRKIFTGTISLFALFAAIPASAVDTIYKNGKVYTVEVSQPWAEAFAVENGRIVSVGSSEQVTKLKTDKTKVVDLKGQFVMPGFIDAHIHPIRSQLMADVDFSNNAGVPVTPQEFAKKIKDYADANPDKTWLTGGAFSWGTFTDSKLNSDFLDAVVSDRPVVIEDETGHIAIANSKALEFAGITEDTEDPVGGYYGREADGSLNGLLYETAMQAVFEKSPNYSEDQVYNSGKTVFSKLNSLGFTGLKIAQGDHLWLGAMKRLDNDQLLNMQVSVSPYEKDFYRLYSNIETIKNRAAYETDHVRVNSVKLLADGVPFGQTMFIKDTYPDSDNHGLPMIPPKQLTEKVIKYNAMGLSVMVHATGDAAAELVLNATEASMQENGIEKVRALRNHIAHNVIVDQNDHDRMKYNNVIMEFSPSFWFPRPIVEQAEVDLGKEMLQTVWPLGPTLRAGINVAIGSDWNQAQADPFINAETLVTRRAPGAGKNDVILGKDSAVTLAQVIHAYTMGGAYAMFMEEELGSIRPGKRANFVVLSQDLFKIPHNRIHKTFVRQTYFEGKLVYQGDKKVSF